MLSLSVTAGEEDIEESEEGPVVRKRRPAPTASFWLLYVISYTTLPSSERVLYPEKTCLGRPLSSSSVKVTTPYNLKKSACGLEKYKLLIHLHFLHWSFSVTSSDRRGTAWDTLNSKQTWESSEWSVQFSFPPARQDQLGFHIRSEDCILIRSHSSWWLGRIEWWDAILSTKRFRSGDNLSHWPDASAFSLAAILALKTFRRLKHSTPKSRRRDSASLEASGSSDSFVGDLLW